MSAPVLELGGVTASYGYRQALNEVDLVVAEGERVAIVGHNGSGKSTLVKCAVGAVPEVTGRVAYRSEPVLPGRVADNMRRGIGFCAQGRNVFPSLTVERNLAIAARAGEGRSDGSPVERAYALFPILADRRRQLAGSLSGGQQQMLSIAMAMATSPGILLLDEPTCGLAPAVVEEVFAALSAVAAANASMPVVIVEQNVVPVLAFAPRAVVVRQGGVAYDGPSGPLREPAALLEYY
jgi:branched-chain amino acid transport system ATP-binding protein